MGPVFVARRLELASVAAQQLWFGWCFSECSKISFALFFRFFFTCKAHGLRHVSGGLASFTCIASSRSVGGLLTFWRARVHHNLNHDGVRE